MNDVLNKMKLNFPKHIAVIMDGNGRWAKSKNKPRVFGHNAGVKRVNEIVECCLDNENIEILTLYTFSSENWSRPTTEVNSLMKLVLSTVNKEINNLIKNGVKVRVIGDKSKLPDVVFKKLNEVVEKTRNNSKLVLNLALNYGSKQEIINGVKLIMKDFIDGKIKLEDINLDILESKLYTYPYPNPDLLIRTGGEHRLSNFLLWQLAYSEIVINSKFWPDYSSIDFLRDIEEYINRERRFGRISEQIN